MTAEALAILDVREAQQFAHGHFPGSGHLEEREWLARRSELPPRDQPVLVVGASPENSQAAARALEALGYARVFALEQPIESYPDARDVSPSRALWRPTPYLAWALDTFAALFVTGPAVDLACGSGRDAVFLAQRGFEVEAWDRAPETLRRAEELAHHCGVRVTTIECDLERLRPRLLASRYGLVTCFRFLHRPLFSHLAAALIPGGLLVIETYRRGQERFGRPTHARFLLEDGELRAAFPGLELLHEEELSPPEGPVTSRLVARRPPASSAS
jgi:tellurite methyltransferase